MIVVMSHKVEGIAHVIVSTHNTKYMSEFKQYTNPWNAEGTEWFNDAKNEWFDNESIELQDNQTAYKSLIETDEQGWLNVKRDSGGIISLAKYCRVTHRGYNSDKTREQFTILDWPNQNVKASVSAISSTKSRFTSVQFKSGGLITFDRQNHRLKYGNSSWIHTATDSSNPINKGTYNLWLPDYTHDIGAGYLDLTKYATIWFRIGEESSSRYLHVGSVSAGCVTVGEKQTGGTDSDKKRWDEIYSYLIKKRTGSKFVGKIKVI